MKKYEKYKDSGIEWIGEIPEKWEAVRLKYIGDAIIGIIYSPDNVTTEDEGTLVLRSSNIQNGRLAFEDCVYVKKEIPEKHLTKEGDILLCARNGSAHLVGKSAYIPKENEGVSFGAFMSIVRSDLGKYLFHFFNSQIFKAQTGLFSTSTINQLTSATLNNMSITIPENVDEQNAITLYLDRKTAQIDELIADKKRLLELYEEEKTSIINQAVTKGINPDVPLKDSGIEWLGEIPEHWEVKNLKYVIKINSGEGIKTEDIKPEGIYPVYGGNGILGYTEDFNSNTTDIIIGRVGAKCGNVRLVENEKWISDNALVANLISDDNERFIAIQLENMDLNNLANKNAQPLITGTMVKEKVGVFPPSTEQSSIVEYISMENTRINAKSGKTKNLIDLLTEYRTALISEVVTGKIKVTE